MHIAVQRSGGFAGLTEELGAIDTVRLKPDVRSQIEGLLQDSDALTRAVLRGDRHGADMFTYRITVTGSDKPRTITFIDDGGEEAAPLRAIVAAAAGQR